jgi:hypothetical protein
VALAMLQSLRKTLGGCILGAKYYELDFDNKGLSYLESKITVDCEVIAGLCIPHSAVKTFVCAQNEQRIRLNLILSSIGNKGVLY